MKMQMRTGSLPAPLNTQDEMESLDSLVNLSDTNETPFNVFIGHNLGHRVFTMSVPFRKFHEISDVANDRDAGPIAQRALDENHGKKLAAYMLKGLISAARLSRIAKGQPVPDTFDSLLQMLGDQPYFSVQPIIANIRNVPPGGSMPGGIRGLRLETEKGETAAFRVFLSERHVLWVVDGQHRRYAADIVLKFLDEVRKTWKYPTQKTNIFPHKGKVVTEAENLVWNEAHDAARQYATLTVEVHLGLDVEQERQLFHDLNRLGKKVDSSLAFQFDGSNPITQFIKSKLVADASLSITESESRDWHSDTGAIVLKDMVAINAIAFLNKGNIAGATPNVIEPREKAVIELWSKIVEVPNFGANAAKEKTVLAQPVVMKALAKLTYDFNFSNRRPSNGDELFEKLLTDIPEIDFSHSNPMWRYYELSESERLASGLATLADFLPVEEGFANRDLGSYQGGFMRFGSKHNDIYPIIADMIRWKTGLPSRHNPSVVAND
jgi:hypothetical protein